MKSSQHMTDEELIQGCIANRAECQKALFERHKSRLMAICMRYAADQDEAHDMLQDGFIKIFDKLETYNQQGKLVGWMCRIMINNCLDQLRRTRHQRHHVEIDEASQLSAGAYDVLAQLSVQDILRYIQALPQGYRTVFNLFAIEGYSHKEIAEQLEINENTSKSQFRKARLQLMQMIEQNNKVVNK